jgi:hypothetical protein
MMNFHDQNQSSDWFSRVMLSAAKNDTAWGTFRLW